MQYGSKVATYPYWHIEESHRPARPGTIINYDKGKNNAANMCVYRVKYSTYFLKSLKNLETPVLIFK